MAKRKSYKTNTTSKINITMFISKTIVNITTIIDIITPITKQVMDGTSNIIPKTITITIISITEISRTRRHAAIITIPEIPAVATIKLSGSATGGRNQHDTQRDLVRNGRSFGYRHGSLDKHARDYGGEHNQQHYKIEDVRRLSHLKNKLRQDAVHHAIYPNTHSDLKEDHHHHNDPHDKRQFENGNVKSRLRQNHDIKAPDGHQSGLLPLHPQVLYESDGHQNGRNDTRVIMHRGSKSITTQTHPQLLDLEKLRQDALRLHNNLRAQHGIAPLILSADLNDYSQKYAEHMAQTGIFEHSPCVLNGNRIGENLAYRYSSHHSDYKVKEAVDGWYREINDYDFKKESNSLSKTGHFTQLVWRETRELGVGKAHDDRGQSYIVANYRPAGNMIGSFKLNVFPPLSQY